MNNKTVRIIGVILFLTGIITIFIDENVEGNFFKTLSEYGKYISILGGALIGVSISKKDDKK